MRAVCGEKLEGPREAVLSHFMRPLPPGAGAGTQDPPCEFLGHQAGRRREAFCRESVRLSHSMGYVSLHSRKHSSVCSLAISLG